MTPPTAIAHFRIPSEGGMGAVYRSNAAKKWLILKNGDHVIGLFQVKLTAEADENTTGPASLIAVDPDGNPILLDQHV